MAFGETSVSDQELDLRLYKASVDSSQYGCLTMAQDTYESSLLGERLAFFWKENHLQEFAATLHAESTKTRGDNTNCHVLAMEFFYGLGCSFPHGRPSIEDFRWVVAHTAKRGLHSWIEYGDEAFDVVVATDSPNFGNGAVVWVRRASTLRQFYEARRVDSRSYADFKSWMDGDFPRLFPKHPELSDALLDYQGDILMGLVERLRAQFPGSLSGGMND